MRRWIVVIFVVVVVIASILGGTLQALQSAIPELQQQGAFPLFFVSTGITAAIANIIIGVMQWFGRSPLDFLPEKTLNERDPKRYRLSKSKDPDVLSKQTDLARKLEEFDWMAVFAEAWAKVLPGEVRAYEDWGEALIRLNQLDQAKEVGRRLISLHKMNHRGYALVGKADMLQGNIQEAVKNLEYAVIYVEKNMMTFAAQDLAEAYEASGRIDDAITTFKLALDNRSDSISKTFLEEK